jgi:transposase InsO family protein
MELHRNAATCPNSRALIARRVGGGLDAHGGGRGGRRERHDCAPVGPSRRGRRAARGPLFGAQAHPSSHAEAGRAGDRGAAPAAHDRRPDRRGSASPALDRVELAQAVGLGKRSRLERPEPPNRYERRHPGELVHVDIKQLGRISVRGAGHRMVGHRRSRLRAGHLRRQTGFEYLPVMVDDHSRLAYAEVLEGLTANCAVAFLRRAVAWFAERGVRIKAVMSDNGSCYVFHRRRAALRELGFRHLLIEPYRPRTNGKADRLIRHCWRSGPGRASTQARPNAGRRYRCSSTTTTSGDHTAPSANRPQPPE